jgi:SHS2 domain-containing protein
MALRGALGMPNARKMAQRYTLPQPYEELDHTADLGVVVRGHTADEALARLVLALSQLLTGGRAVVAERALSIGVEAGNRAAMAVDVLRELLYRFDTEGAVPASCEVRRFDEASGTEAIVEVGNYDPQAYAEGTDLKAVTLHAAHFEPDEQGWLAQVVFDV